ncbi:hypothetical protein [Helicobacter sp.]|uniref:hypothetical protein n=1 Tax=Helicobacter sp. TaxID=218 RepID=UPI001991B9E0|nr:hypothetical protein [Helicobacter sp.]MBD5164369.1 hypothetical protein [Helicobacter sp.]
MQQDELMSVFSTFVKPQEFSLLLEIVNATEKRFYNSLIGAISDKDKDTTTKKEKQQIKKAIESALLRYFSTPSYPKKIKEVEEAKGSSLFVFIRLSKYNDFTGIYYGDIEVVFDGAYPFIFKQTRPLAFNRESQFSYLTEYINDIIKEIADEIFQTANEELPTK